MKYTAENFPVAEDTDTVYDALLISNQQAAAFVQRSPGLGPGNGQLATQIPNDTNGPYPQLVVGRIAPHVALISGSLRAASAIAAGTYITIADGTTNSALPAAVRPKYGYWQYVDIADGATVKRIRFIIKTDGTLMIHCAEALATGASAMVGIVYRLY